jgi:drug/metabolite transporter (DMT)-like permease
MGILGKLTFATGADALTVVTWRALIAAALVGGWFAFTARHRFAISLRDAAWFAVLGFVGIALNYTFFFMALERTSVATAIVIAYSYPLLVSLSAVVFLGERLTPIKAAGVICGLIGCALAARAYDPASLSSDAIGLMFGAGAAITKTVYTVMSKQALKRHPPQTVILYAFLFGSAFLALYLGRDLGLAFDLPVQGWAGIAGIAVLPTLVGYSLFIIAMKHVEASRAAITAMLEPVLAVALAFAILSEVPEAGQLIGMAIVLVSVLAVQMEGR